MTAAPLGRRLREILLLQAQDPGGLDGRRLQGVVVDLCGADQQELLPALRYLMVCPPFLRALRASPPLADPRLADQLRTELGHVFAPALCARMEPVIEQLLARPPVPAPPKASPPPVAAPVPAAPARAFAPESVTGPPRTAEVKGRGGAPAALVALLAFLSGGLAVALAAVLSGVGLPRRSPPSAPIASPSRPDPAAPALPSPAERQPPRPTQTPPVPASPELPAPAQESAAVPATPDPPAQADGGSNQAGGDTAATSSVATAVAAVEALYTALSAGDPAGALQRVDGSAADQFDPSFHRQFREVEVTELRPTATEGSTVTLDGVVTFVYPDGSRQRESRSFTVDTARTPPRVTASSFGRVLSPRR